MTGVAIYARVSTARQAERDLSLPDQIAQCRAYCERQGWDVVEVSGVKSFIVQYRNALQPVSFRQISGYFWQLAFWTEVMGGGES